MKVKHSNKTKKAKITKKVKKDPPKVEKKPDEDEPEQPFWNDIRGVCEKRVCE